MTRKIERKLKIDAEIKKSKSILQRRFYGWIARHTIQMELTKSDKAMGKTISELGKFVKMIIMIPILFGFYKYLAGRMGFESFVILMFVILILRK